MASKTPIGAPSGIAGLAHSVGKPGRTQNLGSLIGRRTAGLSANTGGNSAMQSLNHYGKGGAPMLDNTVAGGVDPTAHAGAKMVRGGSMSPHIRSGGLGPNKISTPGPFDAYSPHNADLE
jgi:hypothetical protein